MSTGFLARTWLRSWCNKDKISSPFVRRSIKKVYSKSGACTIYKPRSLNILCSIRNDVLPYCTEAIRRICRLVGISVQSEIRGDCLFIFLPLYNLFNPLALRALPLYSLQEHRRRGLKSSLFFLCCFATPCNATGHGRERGEYSILLLLLVLLFLPCVLQCKI